MNLEVLFDMGGGLVGGLVGVGAFFFMVNILMSIINVT